MSTQPSLVDDLPPYVPRSEIRVTEELQFEQYGGATPKTVYSLQKRPFSHIHSVTAVIGGVQQDLTVGVDVESRDSTGDGNPDAIAFTGDQLPDVGSTVSVTYVTLPVIVRYSRTVDRDLEIATEKVDAAADARYVSSASGEQLDRIGRIYGPLGQRLGRSDDEYRQLLRSIVQAFSARGTKPDIRFVASTALRLDEAQIEIEEDFETSSFAVRVEHPNNEPVYTASLNQLIDLASPSGVDTFSFPTLYTRTGTVSVFILSEDTERDSGDTWVLFTTTQIDRDIGRIGVQGTELLLESLQGVVVGVSGSDLEKTQLSGGVVAIGGTELETALLPIHGIGISGIISDTLLSEGGLSTGELSSDRKLL